MDDNKTATLALLEALEPVVVYRLPSKDLTLGEVQWLAACSQAVSLRRIADALSNPTGLNEVFIDAVNNLSNTLAEHRMYSQ